MLSLNEEKEIAKHKICQQAALYGYDIKKNILPNGCEVIKRVHNPISGF